MARAKLRKPFVVTTVSIGAAALACSSSDGGSSGTTPTSGQPDAALVTTNPPSIQDCPTVKPIEGSSCPENDVVCDYSTDAACGDPVTTGRIACEVGLWVNKLALPACADADAGEDAAADADAAD